MENIPERNSYTCTRCKQSFKNVERLRVHIINCAPDTVPTPPKSPKRKRHRKFPRKFLDSEHDLMGSPQSDETSKQSVDKDKNDNVLKTKTKKSITTSENEQIQKKNPVTPPPVEEEDTGKVRRKRSCDIGYVPGNHVRRREMTEVLDQHQCRGCGVKFRSISLLERHIRKCDEKEKFKDIKVMKSTINESFHRKLKQMCFYCGKEFAYPKTLMNHFRAFCIVKKEKVKDGKLSQEEKDKEEKVLKILKQQDFDRNEIVMHDLEGEENGPKKGWPKGMKRKSRRKTHSWTYIKKKKLDEEEDESTSGDGKESSSTSPDVDKMKMEPISEVNPPKDNVPENKVSNDNSGEKVKKQRKKKQFDGRLKELPVPDHTKVKEEPLTKTDTVSFNIKEHKNEFSSNLKTKYKSVHEIKPIKINPDVNKNLKNEKNIEETQNSKKSGVVTQKLIKLTPVKKHAPATQTTGPPEILTVAKAVSKASNSKKNCDKNQANLSPPPKGNIKKINPIDSLENTTEDFVPSVKNSDDKFVAIKKPPPKQSRNVDSVSDKSTLSPVQSNLVAAPLPDVNKDVVEVKHNGKGTKKLSDVSSPKKKLTNSPKSNAKVESDKPIKRKRKSRDNNNSNDEVDSCTDKPIETKAKKFKKMDKSSVVSPKSNEKNEVKSSNKTQTANKKSTPVKELRSENMHSPTKTGRSPRKSSKNAAKQIDFSKNEMVNNDTIHDNFQQSSSLNSIQPVEKRRSGLQALLDVVTLEGFKETNLGNAGTNDHHLAKPNEYVYQSPKDSKFPLRSNSYEDDDCGNVAGMCNVGNSVFSSGDVKEGLAPLNNLLQLAQVAADVLQGVVSKVEENNDVYSHNNKKDIMQKVNSSQSSISSEKSIEKHYVHRITNSPMQTNPRKKRVSKSPIRLPSRSETSAGDDKNISPTSDISR